MDPFSNVDISRERAYQSPFSNSPWLPLLLLSLATQKHVPITKSQFRNEYDYIVVGSGPAGSAVASRLSELPCINVLLLEAGPLPPIIAEISPISFDQHITNDVRWNYTTTSQKHAALGTKDRKMPIITVKTLGGASSVNGMIYVRGNRRNFDEWKSLGAEGWGYEDVLPYFKKLEDNTDFAYLANGFHSTGGPITASTRIYNNVKKSAAIEAARSLGYLLVDTNAWEQIGFYDYQQSFRKGQRCSAAKGYLVPIENRPNIDIVVNAMVRKVIIENKQAVGVEFDFMDHTRRVRARREVIVSAGAINTPKLLMLSGIGPMSELQKHQIPLVADLPVGFNFHDHMMVQVTYEVDSNVPRFAEEVLKEQNILEYLHRRTGPLTSLLGIFLQAYLSNSDSRTPEIPDYCLYIQDLSDAKTMIPPGYSTNTNKSFISCASQQLHSYSRGTVSLRSADPYDPPNIDPNYLSDSRDVHDMVEGLKMCQRLMETPAFKRLGAKKLDYVDPNSKEFVKDDDLYFGCLVKTRAHCGLHVAGSCRMGDPEDPRTVVDPQLRVKGVKRLRVVDASIMPTVTWGNTNIPTTMIGEKAADIIKSSIKCEKPFLFNVPYFWVFYHPRKYNFK